MSDQETNNGNWNVAAQTPTDGPEPFEHYFMGKWFETIADADIAKKSTVDPEAENRYLHSRIDDLYKHIAELQQTRLPWWKRWFK